MAKQKNIIFLHLESISRANLWQFRNELGTVWRLMLGALQFNRFFTASTSTVMTMSDVRYGDSSVKDCCSLFRMPATSADLSKYLFTEHLLKDRGYKIHAFHSSPYAPPHERRSADRIALNIPDVPLLCDKALAYLELSKRENRPFYAYFWDDSSHLAYVSPLKENARSLADRMRVAYALVDASLNRLLSGLAQMGIWDDTIIVGFGDHGDEAWSHGLNRGYCHSLIPYASQTWTPMFIYHPERFEPAVTERLASMVDLQRTVMGLLFPDREPLPRLTEFAGVDLFSETRELAFSQNMYALQREKSDPEKGMIKGYAVTDGAYRLVVSSGGGRREDGGMALYCDQADPSNSLNLLRYFRLDRDGGIRKFSPPADAAARHFIDTFREPQVESLVSVYGKLRHALRGYVRSKEKAALVDFERLLNTPAAELAESYGRYVSKSGGGGTVDLPSQQKRYEETQQVARANTPEMFPEMAFTMVKNDQ